MRPQMPHILRAGVDPSGIEGCSDEDRVRARCRPAGLDLRGADVDVRRPGIKRMGGRRRIGFRGIVQSELEWVWIVQAHVMNDFAGRRGQGLHRPGTVVTDGVRVHVVDRDVRLPAKSARSCEIPRSCKAGLGRDRHDDQFGRNAVIHGGF